MCPENAQYLLDNKSIDIIMEVARITAETDTPQMFNFVETDLPEALSPAPALIISISKILEPVMPTY
jgi:hypothetical protein